MKRERERHTNRGDVSKGVVSLFGTDQVVLSLFWFPSFQHWQKKKGENKILDGVFFFFCRCNVLKCAAAAAESVTLFLPFFTQSPNNTSEVHVHAQERVPPREKRRAEWKL